MTSIRTLEEQQSRIRHRKEVESAASPESDPAERGPAQGECGRGQPLGGETGKEDRNSLSHFAEDNMAQARQQGREQQDLPKGSPGSPPPGRGRGRRFQRLVIEELERIHGPKSPFPEAHFPAFPGTSRKG